MRPKPPHLRQRRNRAATRATLPSVAASAGNAIPPLPDREGGWHPRVTDWWAAVWTSPMASEYIESDRAGLHLLAELHERFWTAEGSRTKASLSAEIRQQEARFGLSPVARRTLQWSIDRGEDAEERTRKRRTSKRLQEAAAKDPREVLRVVRSQPPSAVPLPNALL